MRTQTMSTSLKTIATISCLFLATACSTTPPTKPSITTTETPTSTSSLTKTQQIAAQHAEQQGDYNAAAELYLTAAQNTPTPEKYDLQLKAVQSLLKSQQYTRAQNLVNELSTEVLSNQQLALLNLRKGQTALAFNQPDQGYDNLALIIPELLNEADKKDYLLTLAETLNQLNKPEDAFFSLTHAAKLSTPIDTTTEDALWNTLMQIPKSSLDKLSQQSTDATDLGWVSLAQIFHSYTTLSTRLDLALEQWHSDFPQHPASKQLIDSIKTLQSQITFQPNVIAVLLPQSGPFANAGEAIKIGLVAALFNNDNPDYKPELRFYDTGELLEQAMNAYDRATHEGAELIIGPLNKDYVAALTERESLPVPTLALNSIATEHATENLFLFGLSPEDEAEQIAEKAWLDGYNNALVLTPRGTWGDRLSTTFNASWSKLGSNTLEVQNFEPQGQDFSKPLQALLNLDESQARINNIKRLLGRELRTEPRRRQDVDFIFLVATPQQARQIRPQLKFFYAESIPIYATSHLYTGIPDRNKDHDMNDIIFCDMPWVLNDSALWQSIQSHWPNQATAYKRLFALGIDSFNIIPHLRRLSAYKSQEFSGYSGVLSLDELQRVKRDLLWARFSNGRAKLLQN